jgi:hypothetical protein
VRPHLMAPVRTVAALTGANSIGFVLTPAGLKLQAGPPSIPNGWGLSADVVNDAGQAPDAAFMKSACPSLAKGGPAGGAVGSGAHVRVSSTGPGPQAFQNCVAKVAAKYHEVVTYQPASRFWAFQGLETALFVVLALLLAGICFWWVRHRLS